MITLLVGENSFEIERSLDMIKREFAGQAERIDGASLDPAQLPELLMGGTLFAEKRLVVIKGLSGSAAAWTALTDWLPRTSDDIHLVLVETKPDKRTKTYKDLQKLAAVAEHHVWTERDATAAERWVAEEATRQEVSLDKKSIQHLVRRAGIDQWELFHAIEKLALVGNVTPELIDELIEANPEENIFLLFETALRGDMDGVRRMLATLKLTEDPFRLFGLISGQAFQLAALAVSDKPSAAVASDLGVHPYGLSKLSTLR